MLYICPKCREKLIIKEKSFVCNNNHVFDIAKKGYVNLLLNTDKNSLIPGDTKESLIARNNFLNKNYYDCILEEIIKQIKELNKEKFNLLDIGCGEGYYTNKLKSNFKDSLFYGFDISKDGINIASNYTKDINWFVANSKNIPIKDNSIDYVLAMFSFVTPEEIERVLKADGYIIQVCALDNHLIELKNIFYDNVDKKEIKNKLLPFDLVNQVEVNKKILINNNEDIINLFKMTPHYYRVSSNKKDKINDLDTLEITVNILINIYKKQINI